MLDITSRCGDLLHTCMLQFVCLAISLICTGSSTFYFTAEVEVKDQQQIQTETTETRDQHVQAESVALQQGAVCMLNETNSLWYPIIMTNTENPLVWGSGVGALRVKNTEGELDKAQIRSNSLATNIDRRWQQAFPIWINEKNNRTKPEAWFWSQMWTL